MDDDEMKLLAEGNALKARELDLREKRDAALRAILGATLLVAACVAIAGWGIGGLRTLEPDLARAVFLAACSSAFLFYFMGILGAMGGRAVAFLSGVRPHARIDFRRHVDLVALLKVKVP